MSLLKFSNPLDPEYNMPHRERENQVPIFFCKWTDILPRIASRLEIFYKETKLA
jgi:hypothetical protein